VPGRYIALINPDVIVVEGCLDALADFLDEKSQVGNVGPRVFNPDMTQPKHLPAFSDSLEQFCSARDWPRLSRIPSCSRASTCSTFPTTAHCPGRAGRMFSMIRRETFDEVGLLDENLFMYGDDVDWCRRCWKAGWEGSFLSRRAGDS